MFEYEMYKLKRKHKESISLGEFKDTLNKATQLANVLLEKAINDILDAVNERELYIHGNITWIDYANQFIESDLRELLSLATNTNTNLENVYNINVMHYNIDLFKELIKNLYDIRSIIYKGIFSDLVLTNIKEMNIEINFDKEKEKYYLSSKDTIRVTDHMQWLDMPSLEEVEIKLLTSNWVTNIIDTMSINVWQPKYDELKKLVDKITPMVIENQPSSKKITDENKKIKITNKDFFINVKEKSPIISKSFYNPEIIKLYDLSEINFNNVNITGLDISHNLEAHINFDKMVKDLTDSNINGYNLNKYTLRNFNLTNTDLRNTGATIDIASCIINEEGKINTGTLFDESNKFIFGSKELTSEDVERIGIKIKSKVIK